MLYCKSIWFWHNISSGLLNFNLVQVNSELCAQLQVMAESQAQRKIVYWDLIMCLLQKITTTIKGF